MMNTGDEINSFHMNSNKGHKVTIKNVHFKHFICKNTVWYFQFSSPSFYISHFRKKWEMNKLKKAAAVKWTVRPQQCNFLSYFITEKISFRRFIDRLFAMFLTMFHRLQMLNIHIFFSLSFLVLPHLNEQSPDSVRLFVRRVEEKWQLLCIILNKIECEKPQKPKTNAFAT